MRNLFTRQLPRHVLHCTFPLLKHRLHDFLPPLQATQWCVAVAPSLSRPVMSSWQLWRNTRPRPSQTPHSTWKVRMWLYWYKLSRETNSPWYVLERKDSDNLNFGQVFVRFLVVLEVYINEKIYIQKTSHFRSLEIFFSDSSRYFLPNLSPGLKFPRQKSPDNTIPVKCLFDIENARKTDKIHMKFRKLIQIKKITLYWDLVTMYWDFKIPMVLHETYDTRLDFND